ncbi:MAG: hypothetical protein ACSLE0_22055 [Chitinophagaceae bacterium]
MTTFKIQQSQNGSFHFHYALNIRLKPVILFGTDENSIEDCLDNINMIQKQIFLPQYFSFTCNQTGYRFTLYSTEGSVLAYSRYFPTQKIMKRMLSILRKHISYAKVERKINPTQPNYVA